MLCAKFLCIPKGAYTLGRYCCQMPNWRAFSSYVAATLSLFCSSNRWVWFNATLALPMLSRLYYSLPPGSLVRSFDIAFANLCQTTSLQSTWFQGCCHCTQTIGWSSQSMVPLWDAASHYSPSLLSPVTMSRQGRTYQSWQEARKTGWGCMI